MLSQDGLATDVQTMSAGQFRVTFLSAAHHSAWTSMPALLQDPRGPPGQAGGPGCRIPALRLLPDCWRRRGTSAVIRLDGGLLLGLPRHTFRSGDDESPNPPGLEGVVAGRYLLTLTTACPARLLGLDLVL